MLRLRRYWSTEPSLCEVKAHVSGRCSRKKRVAFSAGLFLGRLLGAEQRKTGWIRVEAAANAPSDIMRDYVVELFVAKDAVLVMRETGFLKQGKSSCGVGRQYTSLAGKITNCQIRVFAARLSLHQLRAVFARAMNR